MEQQTAVQWLINNLPDTSDGLSLGFVLELNAKLKRAKEMEKEQIENAYNAGSKEIEQDRDNAAWYYFETYVKE